MTTSEEPPIDPRLLVVIMVVLASTLLYQRGFLGAPPHDLSAYLAAADTYAHGRDPYTAALETSRHYQGYPYVYPPLTLWLIQPLTWIPAHVVSMLDWIARAAVIVGSLRYLGRTWTPHIPLGYLLFAALFHAPLLTDILAGNVATFTFGGVLLTLALSRRGRSPGRGILSFGVGVLFGFKPMWTLPAFYAALSQRAWWAAAGVVTGCASVLGLGAALMPTLTTSWLTRVGEVRAFYKGFDLLELAPWALPILAIIASGIAIDLLRRKPHPDLWLLGCLSLPIWPRLGTYSYILTLPWIFWLMHRKGVRQGLFWSLPVLGPIPWLLHSVNIRIELGVLYVYVVCAALYFVTMLYRESET